MSLAFAYHKNKDYSNAFKLYLELAEEGDASAEYFTGYCYESGKGTQMDIQKAVYWYKKAAEKENISAQAALGYFYETGIGVEKDEEKAFSLYKRAAEKGDSFGQKMLAFAYYEGNGTPKNGKLALYWMEKAKENGDEGAEKILPSLETLVMNEKEYGDTSTEGLNSKSSITVLMDKRNTVYYVPCKINGVKADFIFDTGAGAISLSSYFANELIKQGKLTDNDYIGEGSSRIADGSISSVLVVNIKDVEIGGLHLYNVKAVIKEQQNAPLLLGQTAIEKLGRITIDGYKLIIHRE